MVSFSDITARGILDHIFLSCGIITVVDLKSNTENICKAWYPQQPAGPLFNKIHDCVYFSVSGGITIVELQDITTVCINTLTTGIFDSSWHKWD